MKKVLFINGGSLKIHAHLTKFEITFIGCKRCFLVKHSINSFFEHLRADNSKCIPYMLNPYVFAVVTDFFTEND